MVYQNPSYSFGGRIEFLVKKIVISILITQVYETIVSPMAAAFQPRGYPPRLRRLLRPSQVVYCGVT